MGPKVEIRDRQLGIGVVFWESTGGGGAVVAEGGGFAIPNNTSAINP